MERRVSLQFSQPKVAAVFREFVGGRSGLPTWIANSTALAGIAPGFAPSGCLNTELSDVVFRNRLPIFSQKSVNYT